MVTPRSRIEEPYCERDTLLQEIRDLCKGTEYLKRITT